MDIMSMDFGWHCCRLSSLTLCWQAITRLLSGLPLVMSEDQKKVILWGTVGAIVIRIVATSRCTALNDPRLAIDRWLCPVVDCLLMVDEAT